MGDGGGGHEEELEVIVAGCKDGGIYALKWHGAAGKGGETSSVPRKLVVTKCVCLCVCVCVCYVCLLLVKCEFSRCVCFVIGVFLFDFVCFCVCQCVCLKFVPLFIV